MHTQTNESPVDDRFANVAVELDELLERGEISREAFAVYAGMARACVDPGRQRSHALDDREDPAGARFWG